MRFDDRLATLLAAAPRDSEGRGALWSQLADVCAQGGGSLPPHLLEAAMARLAEWRDNVPAARRRLVAASIASPRLPSGLFAMFSGDTPLIAAPIVSRASFPAAEWIPLIHDMPAASRNLLRERRDLPAEAARTLAIYAPTDLTLPAGVGAREEAQPIQIRDLVARIEAYRKDHPPQPRTSDLHEPVSYFRFETSFDHVVHWVEGVERSALIGLPLDELAPPGQSGAMVSLADAAGAREDFRDRRLFIAGHGPASGWWSVAGKAIFDDRGTFSGFRCVARRSDDAPAASLLAGGLAPDSMRQLVHELRTPLNAIRGFSEMISGQFVGPVAREYRSAAEAIARNADRLSAVINDLDLAARLDSASFDRSPGECDIGRAIRRCAAVLRPIAEERGFNLRVKLSAEELTAAISDDEADRLIGRLLSLILNEAAPAEGLDLTCHARAGQIQIEITTPKALKNADMTDFSEVGAEDGSALGMGFGFRLARAFAQACEGQLLADRDSFTLILPAPADSAPSLAATG